MAFEAAEFAMNDWNGHRLPQRLALLADLLAYLSEGKLKSQIWRGS